MDDLLRGREALFIHGEEHRTQTNNTVSTKECNYLITATTVMLVAAEGMRIVRNAHNVLTPAGGSKFLAQSSQISSRSAQVTLSSVLTQARSLQSMRRVTEIEERDWAW